MIYRKFSLLSERSSSNRQNAEGTWGIRLFKLKQTALVPAYILLLSETKLQLKAKQITRPRVKNAECSALLRDAVLWWKNLNLDSQIKSRRFCCLRLNCDGCDSCHTRVSCLGFRRLRGWWDWERSSSVSLINPLSCLPWTRHAVTDTSNIRRRGLVKYRSRGKSHSV